MKPTDRDLTDSLRRLLQGRVCLVGVGNRQRGDDGAGPRVIDLRDSAARGVWLDAGTAPENFLEPIARTKPDTVLIVDAVSFGGMPGECRLLDATSVDSPALSTHAGSLSLLSDYLSARTGAHIRLLAIQPERIDLGQGLSQPVEKSVTALTAILSQLLAPQTPATSTKLGD